MTKIRVEVEVAPPRRECTKHKSIEQRVRELLEDIDSGHPSAQQWEQVRRLFNKLACKPKLSKRAENLLRMMEPIIEKYGMMDPKGVDLQATYPFERNKQSDELKGDK